MKSILATMAVTALTVFALSGAPARADDSDGALVDGGSIITTTDGGSLVVADLGPVRPSWVMALRCEGAQSTRYKLCTTSTCTPTASNQLLDYDVTQDIGVNRQSGSDKRYLGLKTDDAGIPLCKAQVNR